MKPLLAIVGAVVLFTAESASAEPSIDRGWRFHLGEVPGAETAGFADADWRLVDLPHDWSAEDLPPGDGVVGPYDRNAPDGSDVGYARGGVGWYRRTLTDAERPKGSGLELVLGGAQQECDLWVNGTHVGFQPHGYIPLRVEIGSYLRPRPQSNEIAVRVVNPERNSRWYSGSGLYRGVTVRGHPALHLPTWGVRMDTLWIDRGRAGVQVSITVQNEDATPASSTLQLELTAPDGSVTRHQLGELRVGPTSTETLNAAVTLNEVSPWTPEQPRLYQSRVQLVQAGRVADEAVTRFGVRTVTVSAELGLRLNGTPIKLRGGCVHHDNGLLGARAFADADWRRVRLLKQNGYNAVRTAHNPPSTAFLDACDELGVMVIDEFADSWELPKRLNGYQRYFASHAERDLPTMIDRDFNHPSVIGWSIGNEIPERFSAAGAAIARRLAGIVHDEDPRRFVTSAINPIWEDPTKIGHPEANDPAFQNLDVGGYNYLWRDYETDHARVPQRVMFGSESYPLEAWENWSAVERHPYVIGDFVWSAIDYLGESGIGHTAYVDASTPITGEQDGAHLPWPVHSAWCGDIDLIGDKKPQSYYRDVVWRRSKLALLVHEPIPTGKEKVGSWGWPAELPSWSWSRADGRPLAVSVYSRAQRVQLELNGRAIGEQTIDPSQGITAHFTVPWTPGTLTATAWDGDTLVATTSLRTAGPAAALRLDGEGSEHRADRETLIFVPITVVDRDGVPAIEGTLALSAEVQGEAELCAFGSADPAAVESTQDAKTMTFRGRALAILRATGQEGPVRLTVSAPGLPPATVTAWVGAHAPKRSE